MNFFVCSFVLISAFVCINAQFWETCHFYASEEENSTYDYYDFNSLQNSVYSFANPTQTFYFSFCGNLDNAVDSNGNFISCTPGSAVCMRNIDGSMVSVGTWNNTSISIPVALTYGSGDYCSSETKYYFKPQQEYQTYNTFTSISCDETVNDIVFDSVEINNCTVIAYARSIAACPITVYIETEHVIRIPFLFFVVIMVAIVCSISCCIRCCIRQRRNNRILKQNLEMVKYSNVAFQPLPQVAIQMMPRSPMTMPNPMPFVVPSAPQPMMYGNQQVPVYPFPHPYVAQQQQLQQLAVTQPQSQIEADEKLARELQRQLNQ